MKTKDELITDIATRCVAARFSVINDNEYNCLHALKYSESEGITDQASTSIQTKIDEHLSKTAQLAVWQAVRLVETLNKTFEG